MKYILKSKLTNTEQEYNQFHVFHNAVLDCLHENHAEPTYTISMNGEYFASERLMYIWNFCEIIKLMALDLHDYVEVELMGHDSFEDAIEYIKSQKDEF